MSKLSLLNKASLFSVPLLLTLVSSNAWTLAQTNNTGSADNVGIPGRRVAGGTRNGSISDSCNASSKPLVAIVPENAVVVTTSESPTLFFYVPETNQPQEMEFVLRDQNDALIYDTTWTANGKAGIVSLKVPDVVKSALQNKQDYHWYFTLVCNHDRSLDLVVEGLIRQTSLDAQLAQKLDKSSLVEKVELYQQAQLWNDALKLVSDNLTISTRPELMAKWTELLASMGLDHLAQEPLVASYIGSQPAEPTLTSRK
jgi:hypothetical protein